MLALLSAGGSVSDSQLCLKRKLMMELYWAVNDMVNAMYEIDVYNPGLFMRITDQLRTVI